MISKKDRILNRYQKARKRWIKELYNQEILGEFNIAQCKVVEILPGDKEVIYRWGHEKWVSKKEYDTGRYKENFSIESVISKYDLVYFMLCGWARKAGFKAPPKEL